MHYFSMFVYRGWINGLGTIGSSTGAGAVMLIVAFCLSVCSVATIIMLIKVGIPNPVELTSFTSHHVLKTILHLPQLHCESSPLGFT